MEKIEVKNKTRGTPGEGGLFALKKINMELVKQWKLRNL